MEKFLKYLLQHGFIRPSRSNISSAVFFVPKADGRGLRLVQDFRAVNQATVPDRWPTPNLDSQLEKMSGFRYYSVFDFVNGFWQIKLREGDQYKTAFASEFGLFEWTVMPQGLQGAPATFCRYTTSILGHFDWCSVYVDDCAVFTND